MSGGLRQSSGKISSRVEALRNEINIIPAIDSSADPEFSFDERPNQPQSAQRLDELLKNVRFEPTSYKILQGEIKNKERIYHTAAPDFELGCFVLEAGKSAQFTPSTAEMLLLTEGMVEISAGDEVVRLQPGTPSAIAIPGNTVRMQALEKSAVYRASVPIHSGE